MAGALEGQVAVVTGASRGIGRACAIELAREGASVVVNYLSNADAAEATRDAIHEFGGTVVLVKADVSDAQEAADVIETAVEELGKIDILVNNAGINRDRTIARLSCRGLGRGHPDRPVVDVLLHARRNTSHARGQLRPDHQHVFGDRADGAASGWRTTPPRRPG